VPRQPWQPPPPHGRNAAPLPARTHTTIRQHSGQLLYASAPGVRHHGCCNRPFRSRRVDGHCGLVVGCVLRKNMQGFVPGDQQYPSDKVTMSIVVGIRAVGAAAFTSDWLLCCIVQAATSLGNDAWWQRRQNRRKKRGRRRFLQQVSLHIDRSWWSPSSYSHHGAPLPAFKHTIISKHTMRQDYVVKTRKKYH
jgi:hypothetical protein